VQTIKAGDFVAWEYGRGPLEFGVITEVDKLNPEVLSVQCPDGVFYVFRSDCLPYKEWLSENGF